MAGLTHTLNQANDQMRRGRLEQAEKLLCGVVRLVPRHAKAHNQLARIAVLKSDWAKAAASLTILCGLEPKVVSHWVRLAQCFSLGGDADRARAALERARQLGVDATTASQVEDGIAEPPQERQQSLLTQYEQGVDPLTCEILAHLYINDYPLHPLGWQILERLLSDSGRVTEALEIKQKIAERFGADLGNANGTTSPQTAPCDYTAYQKSA